MEKHPTIGSGLQLDEHLARRIEHYAHVQGVTAAELIHQILQEYMSGRAAVEVKDGRRTLADVADSIAEGIPVQEWAKLPTDLSKNFDHYAFGYPRED